MVSSLLATKCSKLKAVVAKNQQCHNLKEKQVKMDKKPIISTKFRFSDYGKKDDKFGAAVFSRSDSPSYSLSILCDQHSTKPIIINKKDGAITATTPERSTIMYPRVIATTDSERKKIVVFSPTTPISPQQDIEYKTRSTKKPRTLKFDPSQEEKVVQEYTFQCGSHNNNYKTKRERSQNQIMGQSAKEAIQEVLLTMPEIHPASTSERSEWCHLIPYRDSQFTLSDQESQEEFVPQSKENLVASTKYLNSKMLVLEETASFLLKNLPPSFSLKVFSTCPVISDSNNVMIEKLLQKISILYQDQVVLTLKQYIKHDFGLNPEDHKQLAAMKDVYSLIAFSINSLIEKLGANVLQNCYKEAQGSSSVKSEF